MWRLWILFCSAGLLGAPAAANAQIYEYISVCKRSLGATLICVVVEEGVKKIVEKSLEEWLATWKSQGVKIAEGTPSILSQTRCGTLAKYSVVTVDGQQKIIEGDKHCVVTVAGQEKIIEKACVTRPETYACGVIWCHLAPASDICQIRRDRLLLRKGSDLWNPQKEICEDDPSAPFCPRNGGSTDGGTENYSTYAPDSFKAFMENYELERKKEQLDSILQR